MKISLKHVAGLIAAQLIASASLWAAAILFSSDSLFSVIIYFYWPCILAIAAFLALIGESGMIAAPLFGITMGILTYSIVFAAILGYLKKKADDRANINE
jgi:Fe2+ transport system protein B